MTKLPSRLGRLALFSIGSIALFPLVAHASNWEIDGSHSAAQFSVRHMMISNVRGEFGKVAGAINVNDADLTKSSLDVSIDATSINTRDAKRDAHLKNPDFFDVAKFPTITFKSTQIAKQADGKYAVTGNLTMHGVTKPVTLTTDLSSEVKDPWGNQRRGATATGKLNRKDFGLVWNKTLDGGGLAVGDEVQLNIDVELVKKADAPAAKPTK